MITKRDTRIAQILMRTGLVVAVFVVLWLVRANLQQLSIFVLKAQSSSNLRRVDDICVANLVCAQGLSGAERLSVELCRKTVDVWAERVRSETQRHLYRFQVNPGDFENSEGYFRMLMMAVVVYEDFGVRYSSERMSAPEDAQKGDHFFSDSRDVFIHGLLDAQRTGTCSSMPVLYVAIGRRLGYPLKLVTTKGHLFLRWEGKGERFNLEATGKGMNRYDDEYFKRWPFPVTDEDIKADGFLKSLTPDEELALFKSIRGHCLMEAHRYMEAEVAYAEAMRLAPSSRGYRLLHEHSLNTRELARKE
jgi:hypothetical protein